MCQMLDTSIKFFYSCMKLKKIPSTSDGALRQLLGMEPTKYLSSIENLLMGTEYGILL